MSDNAVTKKFRASLEKYHMDELIAKAGTVVAAFSGGADSSAMLTLLSSYCAERGIRLCAAHVNHLIRGEDAELDESFCRKYADGLGVRIYIRRVNVPELSEKYGMGLEETARRVRYDFFEELSDELGGAVVATAHNSDDNFETVLFNLMRGCGTHGMSGIRPVRDGKYIRPMLELGGEEIRRWCRENGISYVYDKTNSDTDYTRNYIRHTVMPTLSRLNPQPGRAVTKMTGLLRDDDDFISQLALDELGERSCVTAKELRELHPALTSRMLILLYNRAKTADTTIERRHIDEILRLSKEFRGEREVSVPGGMKAVIGRERVYFTAETKMLISDSGEAFVYPEDGDIFENELYRVVFSRDEHNNHADNRNHNENIYKLSILRSFGFDTIKGTLTVRRRAEGDAYVFGGIRHKIKKLFTDKKMTGEEKALIPIFCDESGIFWIPGFPVRDGVKVLMADEIVPENALTVRVYRRVDFQL